MLFLHLAKGVVAPADRAMSEPDELLTEAEVAARLGLPVSKLRRLRYDRCGPTSIRVAGAVRIRRADLQAWLKAREV